MISLKTFVKIHSPLYEQTQMNDRIQGPVARFERVIISEDSFDRSNIHSASSEKFPHFDGEILTSHSNFQDCVVNLIPSPDTE